MTDNKPIEGFYFKSKIQKMKKLILLFSSLILINISCSDNEEPPLSTEGTLLRRSVSIQNGQQSYVDYHYTNGNKVYQGIGSEGSKVVWIYTGNLIVEQNFYRDNVLKQKETYVYDAQERMIQRKILSYSNNYGYRSEYTYNPDGTVNIIGFNGDLNSQTNQTSLNNKVYLFPNGDVQKIEFHKVINGVNHIETRTYTYDDKNYMMNGILNYNKIKVWETGTYGNTHNNTSITYTTTENASSYTNYATYTYNSQGYPITMSFFGGSITTQHFYQ